MSPTLSTLAKRLRALCRAAMLIVLVVLLVPTAPTLLAGTASGSATRMAPAAAAAPLRAPGDVATDTRAVTDYRAADYREASFTWDGGRSAPTGDPAPTTSPATDSVSDPAAGAPDPITTTATTGTPLPSTTSPDATASAGDPVAGTADVSAPDPSSTPPSDAGTSPDATGDASPTGQAAPDDAASDTADAGSFSPTAALRGFLGTLHLAGGAGPISGTVDNGVLTATLTVPTLPVTLPTGAPALTFGPATLVADTAADTVTITASAAAGSIGATLTVTVAHATTASPGITGTVTITGVPVLGTTVDLSGTLGYTAGATTLALTGTLHDDFAVTDGFVLKAGSTVGLSTADGLTVHGVATVGPAGRSVTVTVDGAVAGADNWSLTVATSDAATYTPVDGFSITPNISGTVAKSDGRVHVTVTGNVDATWAVGGVSMVLSSVAFSNDAPPAGVACPDVKPGELWLDVKGALHADAIGLDAAAEGCVNLSTGAFALSTTVKTGLTPGVYGFALTDATVAVAKAPGSAVQVTAAATLAVSNPGHDDLTLPVQIALGADGTIVGGTGVDLGQLGLGSGSGTLLFASKAVPAYDASAFGIKQPVKLAAGVTILFDYRPSKEVNQALAALQLPAVQTLRAAATLSPSGFAITASVGFGAKTSGAKLYAQDFAGGAAAYLNTLELGIATNGTDVSLSLGGTAYLVLPALYPGGQGSSIGLALNGAIDVTATAVTVNLGFDIAADNGTWSDAFGIPHLSVSRLAGKFGVTITPETAGIPTPSFAIRVDKLKLPTEWSTAIGLTSDATMSLNLALNVTNPILDVTIESSTPSAVALRPFAIAKAISNSTPDSVTHLIEVSRAHLLFAPLGGTDAANQKVYPGVALVFDGKLGGYPVHVDASVGLLPYPHLFADVNISGFKVGTVAIDNTHLTVNLDANPAKPVADLSFSGGFTDSRTGISFAAKFDTGITADAANAKVELTITGGQPGYILATGTLKGSVSASSAGVSFSASGALWMYAAGQYIGQLSFSYSSNAGAVWDQFSTAVGKAYHDAYNWADWQVAQTLRGYRFASTEVAKGVANVYNEGVGAVNTALTKAGYGFDDAVYAVKTYFAATDQALANSFRQAGYTANQIATVLQQFYGEGDRQAAAVLKAAGATTNEIVGALQTTFQEGQAAIYNTLQSIGSAGSTAIDALNGFFNTGAYNIWTYPPPAWSWTLGLSGSGVVTSWGNVFDHSQQWYVLPTDSGYAEIVNRGNGQCLTVSGFSTGAAASLVTYSCSGHPSQQWYLGGAASGRNIGGLSTALYNRNSGMAADVLSQNWRAGATVGQYWGNGGWNQTFKFLPAVG